MLQDYSTLDSVQIDGGLIRAGSLDLQALRAGTVTADELVAGLSLVDVIQSANFQPGTAQTPPVGFKFSGTAFPAQLRTGATLSNCLVELGSWVNIGGVKLESAAQELLSHFLEFLVPGDYTFFVPAGASLADFYLLGGGGGGGDASATCGGGGGGGGSFGRFRTSLVPGEELRLEVGAGGAPNTNGGRTRVVRVSDGSTLCEVLGSGAGTPGSAASEAPGGAPAPVGNITIGSTGSGYDGLSVPGLYTSVVTGGAGGQGTSGTVLGGFAGQAGDYSYERNTYSTAGGGSGGNSPFGAGGRRAYTPWYTETSPGTGGGGAGANRNSGAGQPGGPGLIQIRW